MVDDGTNDADGDGHQPGSRRTLFVPVRSGPSGSRVICLMQTALGRRTAVGFTTRELLTEVLGPSQEWIPLAPNALRTMVAPLGIATVLVNPRMTAPPSPRSSSRPQPFPDRWITPAQL